MGVAAKLAGVGDAGGRTVLIVDDDAAFRVLVRQIVEAAGFRVAGEAANGAEAIRLASQLAPDVITMDLDMPVMGGAAATAELCGGGCAPIVIVSGSASSEDIADALRAGARWHVAKTRVSTDLASALLALCDDQRS